MAPTDDQRDVMHTEWDFRSMTFEDDNHDRPHNETALSKETPLTLHRLKHMERRVEEQEKRFVDFLFCRPQE